MSNQGSLFSEATKSQEAQILRHLQSGRAINPLEALALYQCFRPGARIHELKKAGYNIKPEMIKVRSGKRIASYKLVQ